MYYWCGKKLKFSLRTSLTVNSTGDSTISNLKIKRKEMSNLTTSQSQYMSDDMYLPIHYKGIKVEQPFYSGDGNHSLLN